MEGRDKHFLLQYEDLFPNKEIFEKVIEDFVTTVNLCKEVYENRVPDSIAHYRSFRNRFHFPWSGFDTRVL